MREPGRIVAIVGGLIGLALVAYAVLAADFPDGPESSALGSQIRMILAGLVIATVSLSAGAAVRHKERWTTHVFVGLGALLSIAAVWWAVGQLIG